MDVEAKGERAAQILENEVYQDAVRAAKDKLKEAWARTEDPVQREALWQRYKAAEDVTTELAIIRDRGIVQRDKREKEDRRA